MGHRDDIISASEIGTWCYCKRAWHYQQLGRPSANTDERVAGSRYHRAHFRKLRSAQRQLAAARIIAITCVILLAVIGIADLWLTQ